MDQLTQSAGCAQRQSEYGHRVRSCFLTLTVGWLSCGAPSDTVAQTASNVVDAVVRAHKHNYDLLPPLRATLSVIKEDRSALKSGKRQAKAIGSPSLVLSYEASPRTEWQEIILLKDGSLRYEKTEGGRLEEVLTYSSGVWRQYIPAMQSLRILPLEDLSDRLPVDPRQLGTSTNSIGFADSLLSSNVTDAKYHNDGNQDVARVEMTHIAGKARLVTQIDFPIAFGLLPGTVAQYINDDLVMRLAIDYQSVPDSKAKFPKQAIYRFFPPSSGKNPNQWRESIVYTVNAIEMSIPVADDNFTEIDVPETVRVIDQTAGRIDLNLEEPNYWLFTSVVGLGLVFGIYILITWKRRSLKS